MASETSSRVFNFEFVVCFRCKIATDTAMPQEPCRPGDAGMRAHVGNSQNGD
jgi:hypothetical protein